MKIFMVQERHVLEARKDRIYGRQSRVHVGVMYSVCLLSTRQVFAVA